MSQEKKVQATTENKYLNKLTMTLIYVHVFSAV